MGTPSRQLILVILSHCEWKVQGVKGAFLSSAKECPNAHNTEPTVGHGD